MIEFPPGTLFNKRIAKQKFYDKLKVTGSLEKQFVSDIESIYWRNKLSPETLNVSAGTIVSEIEIIEINLKVQNIGRNLLEFIDREIPYHLVFILRYKNSGRIWINYKEESGNRAGKFKVDGCYQTEWMDYGDLSLEIGGLNLDKIYENFLVQVSGGKLQIGEGDELKNALEKSRERERLEAFIKRLENRIKRERQFNRQVRLMGELRRAKASLEEL